MHHNLALRLAVVTGHLTEATHEAVIDYCSPVPLFGTGRQAAAHGLEAVAAPGPQAIKAVGKLVKRRTHGDGTR